MESKNNLMLLLQALMVINEKLTTENKASHSSFFFFSFNASLYIVWHYRRRVMHSVLTAGCLKG